MKVKTLEHNPNRLLIVITYQDEQFLAGIFVMSGVAILILTYLGIAPKILASFMQGSGDLSIFCYIVGLVVLSYGLFRLYRSFLVSKFAFDKTANKLEVENKHFANTNKQVFPLSEVTGIEDLSTYKHQTRPSNPKLFLWIKKGDQVRGEKIPFTKASIVSLHKPFNILHGQVSEFLKAQSNLILDKEWLIKQDEDRFIIYRSHNTSGRSEKITYTVDRRTGYLICELDGKEIGRYRTEDILSVETEFNHKNDEQNRIILVMSDGSKIPISSYYGYLENSYSEIVRALKYALGLGKYLHFSSEYYAP
jgi:hypothetical protein